MGTEQGNEYEQVAENYSLLMHRPIGAIGVQDIGTHFCPQNLTSIALFYFRLQKVVKN